MSDTPPSSRAELHQGRRPRLLARNALTRAVRGWFEAQAFVEVETAALQVSPAAEAHLHPFSADLIAPSGERRPLHLRTSPEFACKKLLAAGETRIFELARVWRNRERGPLHHPEFTLLEWYRAQAPYEALMEDCAALLALAARTGGRERFAWRGREMDPFAEPGRLSLAEAFDRFAGIDLLATVAADGEADRDALAHAGRAAGVRVADDDNWSDVFSKVLTALVEPRLGLGRATILCEYPAPAAALARLKPAEPRVAERFELYACGVELANAFAELTDAAEQRRRLEAEMAEKQRLYGERFPIDDDFIAAVGEMPPAAGAALGFDRLAMLALGADRIDDVLWSPVADVR
ncbi:MAG: EF-P lysine aminoacylase GenX [Caulobacteraceae bacterium]|nr:EF-P lysine aminoacylase GenX [Caulobacteraceae bacterium]